MSLSNENEAKELIASIFSDPETREKCLTMFVDSIAETNVYGRDRWAVTCPNNMVRLIAGHIIICTLTNGTLWLALDKVLLERSDREKSDLEGTGDWTWEKGKYAEYKEIGSRNGSYQPSERHPKIWPLIRRLHFESIYKAAMGRAKDSRTPPKHEPVMLRYLRNELRRHVPDPCYENDGIERL